MAETLFLPLRVVLTGSRKRKADGLVPLEEAAPWLVNSSSLSLDELL